MSRYVPDSLTRSDRVKQQRYLNKSRRLYKKKKYFERPEIKSFHSRPSKHVVKARKVYQVNKIIPSRQLSLKTGCTLNALLQIVKKCEGAYYSSGSRPSQTAQSWAYARLASAITGGKASKVDYSILRNGCNHNKMAFRLAISPQKRV
jgi:hypothetical protein